MSIAHYIKVSSIAVFLLQIFNRLSWNLIKRCQTRGSNYDLGISTQIGSFRPCLLYWISLLTRICWLLNWLCYLYLRNRRLKLCISANNACVSALLFRYIANILEFVYCIIVNNCRIWPLRIYSYRLRFR
jgi:hypothetical protein